MSSTHLNNNAIYIAGRAAGYEGHNYPAFSEAEMLFASHGWRVINPANNAGDAAMDMASYVRPNFAAVIAADAVALLPNWHCRKEARAEVIVAHEFGLPFYCANKMHRIKSDEAEMLAWMQPAQPATPSQGKAIDTEARELVTGDRGKAYGHPFDDFTRTAKIWAAVMGHEVTAEQVALCMIGLKLSRECHAPKRDNLVDAIGYTMALEMVRARRAEVEAK